MYACLLIYKSADKCTQKHHELTLIYCLSDAIMLGMNLWS